MASQSLIYKYRLEELNLAKEECLNPTHYWKRHNELTMLINLHEEAEKRDKCPTHQPDEDYLHVV